MSNKAQISSLDVIFSLLALFLILSTIFWGWGFISEKMSEDKDSREFFLLSSFALDALVETPGNPKDWHLIGDLNVSEIKSLGISDIPGMVNKDKWDFLIQQNQTNYDYIKNYLGILGPGYEIYIEYFEFNGSNYNKNSSIGMFPVTDIVSRSERIVLDRQKNWVKLVAFLWKQEVVLN